MLTHSLTFRASLCNRRPSATAPVATHTKCQRRTCNVHATQYTRPRLATTALYDTPVAVRGSTRVHAASMSDAQVPTDTLRVTTTEGQLFALDINPGTTTVKDIREAVANQMNLAYDEVRLAYHARELYEADDDKHFEKHSDDRELSAMRRPHAQDEPCKQKSLAADLPPGPQTHELPQRSLTVRTMEGQAYRIAVTPGVTTVGQIRRAVADATGVLLNSVRLQYAGKELDTANDSSIMQFKPEEFLMFSMKRMQGGNKSIAADTHTATVGSTVTSKQRASARHRYASCSVAQQAKAAARKAFKTLDQTPVGAQSTPVMNKPVTAPGAGRGPAEVQLAKQFRDLMKHPIPGVSAAPDDVNALTWHVRLAGPADTPYASGWFDVKLTFDHHFPGTRPIAIFKTSIWHPNIDDTIGIVCINIDNQVCSVGCVISALQQLLKHPNPNSPLNQKCGDQMRTDYKLYVEKARQMTRQHASGELPCEGSFDPVGIATSVGHQTGRPPDVLTWLTWLEPSVRDNARTLPCIILGLDCAQMYRKETHVGLKTAAGLLQLLILESGSFSVQVCTVQDDESLGDEAWAMHHQQR